MTNENPFGETIYSYSRAQAIEDGVHFRVIITGTTHTFKLHIGPGDTEAPVLTLMLPNED